MKTLFDCKLTKSFTSSFTASRSSLCSKSLPFATCHLVPGRAQVFLLKFREFLLLMSRACGLPQPRSLLGPSSGASVHAAWVCGFCQKHIWLYMQAWVDNRSAQIGRGSLAAVHLPERAHVGLAPAPAGGAGNEKLCRVLSCLQPVKRAASKIQVWKSRLETKVFEDPPSVVETNQG